MKKKMKNTAGLHKQTVPNSSKMET
jgi:hypothetical protein